MTIQQDKQTQPEKSGLSLEVDCYRYLHFLEELGATESEKREMIEALWSIVTHFVKLGFGIHPAQMALEDKLQNATDAAARHFNAACGQRNKTYSVSDADLLVWSKGSRAKPQKVSMSETKGEQP